MKHKKKFYEEPQYIGYANKGFKKERLKRFEKQYRERGFDDSVTYSLYSSLSKFVLPRLIRFKEIKNDTPMGLSELEWDVILDKMILFFESVVNAKDEVDVIEGFQLFQEYFFDLWW